MLALATCAAGALALPLAGLSESLGTDPKPFVALMVVGFLVGIAGHLADSRTLIVAGIATIFLATFLLPIGVYIGKS